MLQTTDFGDESFAQIAQAAMEFETEANVALSFFDDVPLVGADEAVLEKLGQEPHSTSAIRQEIKSPLSGSGCRKALTNSGEVFYSPLVDIYTKMRAGDFAMADFEVDGKKFTKTALLPMRISIKTMKMQKSAKKLSALQKGFVSIRTIATLYLSGSG